MYVVHVCCVVCGCARMCHNIIVPPLQVRHIYTGPLDEEDEMAESMLTCDPEVREKRGEQLLGNTGAVLLVHRAGMGGILLALRSCSVYPPQLLPLPFSFPSPVPPPPPLLPPRVLSHSTSPNCIPHKMPPSSTPLAES